MKNEMTLAFDSISENEAFARVAVSAFITQLNPTLEEVADIRTAVSEAVTNAIIHGYPDEVRTVIVRARLTDQLLELWVSDEGTGIANVQKAMEPLYTTSWSDPEWVLCLWKHLWIRFMWSLHPASGRRSI